MLYHGCHAERREASLVDWHQAQVVAEILHSLRSFRMTRFENPLLPSRLALQDFRHARHNELLKHLVHAFGRVGHFVFQPPQ
jgi:hypothetical protein